MSARRIEVLSDYAETAFDASDAGPVPRAFVALMLQVYVLPCVRPVTVMGLPFPVLVLVGPWLDDLQATL